MTHLLTLAARTALTTAVALCAVSALGGAARADDAAACDTGIEMISSEVAKEHPKATAQSLKTALRVAKREKDEKEYDECLDAVADAKKALGR